MKYELQEYDFGTDPYKFDHPVHSHVEAPLLACLEDSGTLLYRVVALGDIPRHGVRKGDVGGFVVNPHNLSQEGDCWVSDIATVLGEGARVLDNAFVGGVAWVDEEATVRGNAVVMGWTTVTHEGVVEGDARLGGRGCAVIDWGRVGGSVVLKGPVHVQAQGVVEGEGELITEKVMEVRERLVLGD